MADAESFFVQAALERKQRIAYAQRVLAEIVIQLSDIVSEEEMQVAVRNFASDYQIE